MTDTEKSFVVNTWPRIDETRLNIHVEETRGSGLVIPKGVAEITFLHNNGSLSIPDGLELPDSLEVEIFGSSKVDTSYKQEPHEIIFSSLDELQQHLVNTAMRMITAGDNTFRIEVNTDIPVEMTEALRGFAHQVQEMIQGDTEHTPADSEGYGLYL